MLSVRDSEGTALNRTCIQNPALLTLREHGGKGVERIQESEQGEGLPGNTVFGT